MATNRAVDHVGRQGNAESGELSHKRFALGDNARGALIMAAGAVMLMGLAFGGMLLLTSPDGWVTKAANSAMSGGETGLPVPVSFADAN